MVDPSSGLTNVLSLYRHNPAELYSVEECNNISILMPHMLEAYRHNTLIHLKNMGDQAMSCVVDCKGYVYGSNEAYNHISREEWPGCSCHCIDNKLLSTISESKQAVYHGRTALFFLQKVHDLIYIVAKKCRRDKRLTVRERMICKGLISGSSYVQIASELKISRSTVTSHANNIYKKLDVTDKLSLARLLSNNLIKSKNRSCDL